MEATQPDPPPPPPPCRLEKISDNEVVAIVLGTWVCSSFATYLWVSLTLYRFHWLGQDLKWIDYLLGPFAPTRPVRDGFDVSHQEALVGKGLFNSELDDSFVRAQEEIAEHNARVAADAAAKSAASAIEPEYPVKPTATDAEAVLTPEQAELAAVKVRAARGDSRGGGGGGRPTRRTRTAPQRFQADTLRLPTPPVALQAKLAAFEAKANTPRKIYEREWREDFRNATVLRKLYLVARYVIMFGIDGREITDYNQGGRAHLAFAPRHEGRTEDMYKSLNVITSCIQSFAHGSNDVANAIGPLSTIYYVWVNNKIPSTNSPVELWQLAYGGAMISLGLWFYGECVRVRRVRGGTAPR